MAPAWHDGTTTAGTRALPILTMPWDYLHNPPTGDEQCKRLGDHMLASRSCSWYLRQFTMPWYGTGTDSTRPATDGSPSTRRKPRRLPGYTSPAIPFRRAGRAEAGGTVDLTVLRRCSSADFGCRD